MPANFPDQDNNGQASGASPSSMIPNPSKPVPQQQTQQSTMQQQAYTGAPQMSIMTERNPAPLAGTPDAEAMKAFNEAIKTLAEQGLNDTYELSVVNVSKNDVTNLFASAIVLVVRHKQNKDAALSHHTMIIGDTAGDLPRNQVTMGNRTVEVQMVIGDAYDHEYRVAVSQAVVRAFPNVSPKNMFDAEAEVIPVGYDYKDLNLVRQTLANALRAAGTVLNSNASNFVDFTLGANAAGVNSTATLSFNNAQSTNSVGEPVRSDIYVSYAEVRGNARQAKPGERVSLNSGERTEQAFGIGGFLDLIWDPAMPQQMQNPYALAQQQMMQQNQPQNNWLYTPRFVITKLDAKILNTLPGQLLGLVTALTLRDNGNWIGAFKRPHTAEFDMHDIGAIGIEANYEKNTSGFGSRIDTRAESFTTSHLAMLVQSLIRPNLAISMDVAECGPDTWLNSVFLAAARGNQSANEAILSAASLLTNGRFQYTGQTVFSENNRIHMGWYRDRDGIKRDIRNVDHLAILNLFGENDPQQVRDWSDTFTRLEYPMDLRLDARRRILEQAIGGNINYTGFAERITFDGHFIEALAAAVAATGLNIRPITPYQDLSTPSRATASWMQNLRLGTQNSGLFNRGYAATTQAGFQSGSGFGRWGN